MTEFGKCEKKLQFASWKQEAVWLKRNWGAMQTEEAGTE
jgi:hypothetical protein